MIEKDLVDLKWNMATLMRFGKLMKVETIDEAMACVFPIVGLFSRLGDKETQKRDIRISEMEIMGKMLAAADPSLTLDDAQELVMQKPSTVAILITQFLDSLPVLKDEDKTEGKQNL